MRSVATHCRSWVGPEGPESLVDARMMFGDKAAANYAQRGTGFMVWLIQSVMDQIVPQSAEARRAYELIRLEDSSAVPRCAFISQYIDDVPMLCVKSVEREVQKVNGAVWHLMECDPQAKKVWPEGGFLSH